MKQQTETKKPVIILSTCPECGGKGFVPHRHITNRRNRKRCARCEGIGEVEKLIQ